MHLSISLLRVAGSLLVPVYALAGGALAVPSLYLLLLSLASFRRQPALQIPDGKLPILAVVVPAHNEEELIGVCVESLKQQTYPVDCFTVVVVADNCTDRTADIAKELGARVLVRQDHARRGKGPALRWTFDQLLSIEGLDAFVIIDADSTADPELLSNLAGALHAGHQVVQADDLLSNSDGSARSELEAVALLLRNRIRFAGRSALGFSAALCGNGMLISAAVLRAQPWSAFSGTEDSEYSMILREQGIRTYFANRARVYASTTPGDHGAYTQGLRWEGGRFSLMSVWIPRLLMAAWRRRDFEILSTVFDLAMPPLALTALLALAGSVGGLVGLRLGCPMWAVSIWLSVLMAVPAYVLISMIAARAGLASYLALLSVPRFLLLKLRVYGRLLAGSGADSWVRTARPGENATARR